MSQPSLARHCLRNSGTARFRPESTLQGLLPRVVHVLPRSWPSSLHWKLARRRKVNCSPRLNHGFHVADAIRQQTCMFSRSTRFLSELAAAHRQCCPRRSSPNTLALQTPKGTRRALGPFDIRFPSWSCSLFLSQVQDQSLQDSPPPLRAMMDRLGVCGRGHTCFVAKHLESRLVLIPVQIFEAAGHYFPHNGTEQTNMTCHHRICRQSGTTRLALPTLVCLRINGKFMQDLGRTTVAACCSKNL